MNTLSRITSPNIPLDMLTVPLSTNLSQSQGLCILPPPNFPLTHSVVNQRGIGATLIMASGVHRNTNHTPTRPEPSYKIMSDNTGTTTRLFPSSSTVNECGVVSTIGISTQTRIGARIANDSTPPSINIIRIGVGLQRSPSNPHHGISHSNAPLEPQRLRTIRGAKRRGGTKEDKPPLWMMITTLQMACPIWMNMEYVMLRVLNKPKNLSPKEALCAFEVLAPKKITMI